VLLLATACSPQVVVQVVTATPGQSIPDTSATSTPLLMDTPTLVQLPIDTPSPLPTLTDTLSPEITTEASPTLVVEMTATPYALVLQNAFCRRGPGTVYEAVTAYTPGTQLEIDGRNADSTWWRVMIEGSSSSCYISATLLELQGNLESVPELPDPPTPTPSPTETFTPSPTLTPPVVGTPAPDPG
jgi:hypothetical protein